MNKKTWLEQQGSQTPSESQKPIPPPNSKENITQFKHKCQRLQESRSPNAFSLTEVRKIFLPPPTTGGG